TPDSQKHRKPQLFGKRSHFCAGQGDDVEFLQCCQTQPQGRRTQTVTPAWSLLNYQAQLKEADEIKTQLAGRHFCQIGKLFEPKGGGCFGQVVQNVKPDKDGLNSTGFGGCYFGRGTPLSARVARCRHGTSCWNFFCCCSDSVPGMPR